MIQDLHIMMNIWVEHPGTLDDLLNSKLLQANLARCTCMDPRLPFPLKVTCVLSPSSLKLPISRVPIRARPSAALAVGAVPCLRQACKHISLLLLR